MEVTVLKEAPKWSKDLESTPCSKMKTSKCFTWHVTQQEEFIEVICFELTPLLKSFLWYTQNVSLVIFSLISFNNPVYAKKKEQE